ncbi:MAG: class I SAM-dependent methyltransferase [Burkholderiales bacterium]
MHGMIRDCMGAATLAVVAGWMNVAPAAEPSVPYVPTPQIVVDRMLQMAKITPQDYVIDLGSGDGRIVVTAAKQYGARGFGVDLNPVRIKEAVENAATAGVSDRANFYQRNLFETDLSQATVITMYLLPRVNLDLRPKLLELKPGTRLVSHDFSMDDWKADETANLDVADKYGPNSGNGLSTVFFWIVPAKVTGPWQFQANIGAKPQAYEMILDQTFQVISGNVRVGGRSVKLQDAKLRGDQISGSFTADVNGSALKHEFAGRVAGGSISGSITLVGNRMQGQQEWSATRGAKTGAADGAARIAGVN